MPFVKRRIRPGRLAKLLCNSREEAVLDDAGVRVKSALWTFAEDGGAADEPISFGLTIPAGAIICDLVVDVIEGADGGDDLQLDANGQTFASSFGIADAGVSKQPVVQTKLAADGDFTLTFLGSDAESGSARFYITYLLPND